MINDSHLSQASPALPQADQGQGQPMQPDDCQDPLTEHNLAILQHTTTEH